MNTLKPDLLWIEGRCYRMNESAAEGSLHYEQDSYECEQIHNDSESEDGEDYEIAMFNNRYKTSFHVPKPYFGSIIGKKGFTKMRLEKETRTEIIIPKPGQDGDVVILGASAAAVKTSRRRINMIVLSSRMRQRPTHFVSIPCNNSEIKENFNKFKEQVLAECDSNGLEESIFILPSKLHLTVGVMPLMDNEERAQATQIFQNVIKGIIRPSIAEHYPLRVRLRGLGYMNDEPKRVDVLYSEVVEDEEPRGLLQRLCNDIYNCFVKSGLMKNEFGRDQVKMHVTLINTRFRGKGQISHSDTEDTTEARPRRQPFDATQILDKFSGFDFGVIEVHDIHLSQMSVYDEEGYYKSTCVISCAPESVS